MQRVLAGAQLREARREDALRKVIQGQPEAPKGLLATFKKEAHRQAVVAWDRAQKAATRLVQEAKRLAERLRDVARPERVKEWAQALMRQTGLQAAVGQKAAQPARAGTAEQENPPQSRPQERVGAQAPQISEQHAALERDAAGVAALLAQSKTRGLTLPEKQQILRGWNAMARLIDDGHRAAPAPFRQTIEVARQQANRQVAADMFLNLPRSEALQHYPALAGHYTVLEAIDRHGEAQGRTSLQRAQERKQTQQRIAAAIEQGDTVQVKAGTLDVTPRQSIRSPQIEREPGKDRGRSR